MGRIKLDRELCFKKWAELGTLPRVRDYLAEQGIINKRTNKPFSIPAIYYAAKRWVVLNPVEAREYYNHYGWYPSDDEWNRWIVDNTLKVFHSHSRKTFEKILDNAGLREEYGYILGEGEKPTNSI